MTRMSRPLHADGKKHRLRNFLVGLTGTDGQDVHSWAEAVLPIILFGMVIVNSLMAFAFWWLAAGVFFPLLTPEQKTRGAAIGALLIGFIDWLVVSNHPSLPGWFIMGAPVPTKRWSGAPVAAGVYPPMPSGLRFFAPYLVRMLLAGVIAIAIGTGATIAANIAAVEDQRRQDAISVTRAEEDKVGYDKREEERRTAMEELKAWHERNMELTAEVKALVEQRRAKSDELPGLEQKIKCESRSEAALQPPGVCQGIVPSAVGLTRAQENHQRARDEIASLTESITKLEARAGAEPVVPEPIPRSTTNVPNPKYEQGLGPTLNAYFKFTQSEPWFVTWGLFLLLLAFDLTPVVFKMLSGYPQSDKRAWARHGRETLRGLGEATAIRLGRTADELALAQHEGALGVARAKAAADIRTATAKGKAERAERVRTATEAAARSRDEIVRLISDHDIEQTRLDLADDAARRAESRTGAPAGQGGPAGRPDPRKRSWFGGNNAAEPGARDDDPTPEDDDFTPPEDDFAQPTDDFTPPEDEAAAPRESSGGGQAPWSPASKFPPEQVWLDPNGKSYLKVQSIVPLSPGSPYSRHDVQLMVQIPDPGTPISERELRRICKVLKHLPEDGPETALANVLPESGQAHGDWWVAPYYPRSDLERYLSQVGHQSEGLQYTRVVEWGRDLLDDLRTLHGMGWAHNDIKVRNIVVDGPVVIGSTKVLPGRGRAHLIDFGSAAPFGERAGGGSPAWRAPESRLPSAQATQAGDVFSVAAVLYYLVTSKRVNEVVGRATGDELALLLVRPEWVDTYRAAWQNDLPATLADTPEVLSRIILQGLAPDPERRPTLEKLWARLGDILPDRTLRKTFFPAAKLVRPSGFSAEIMEVIRRQLGYKLTK